MPIARSTSISDPCATREQSRSYYTTPFSRTSSDSTRALRTPSYSGVTSNAGTSYAERIASIEASRGLRTALNRSSSMYSDVRAPKPRLIESQYTPESSLKRNLSSSNAGLSLRAPIDFMGSPRHRTSSSGVTATRTSSYQSLRGAEPGLQRSTSSTSSALGSSRHLPNANPDAVSGSRVAGRHETGGWTAGPSATSAAVHDVVVVDSFRVDCREVEAVLLEESSVVAAIVIGSADAMRSDALQAFVQFAPANAGTFSSLRTSGKTNALLDACRSKLPASAVPARITVLEHMPPCDTPLQEKLLRRMLQQMSDDQPR